MDFISLLLLVSGGINWELIGIFQFDLVTYFFRGQSAVVSRIIYAFDGLAAIWGFRFFL